MGESGIVCIFIGYDKNFKSCRLYVIDPNDSMLVNIVIESHDAIFDEMLFSLISRSKDMISNNNEGQNLEGLEGISDLEPQEVRRSKQGRIAKKIGFDFQLYLVEGSRDDIRF